MELAPPPAAVPPDGGDPPGTDAMVTIGDLIDDPKLSITPVVLPPGGAERAVSWVHATEQVDPRPHLREHELVCTLGSSLLRPRTADVFVSAAVSVGVAGIALGLGEVHLEPPTELIVACERAGLPLLLLEHGVPFLAVNDCVLKKRTQIESEARQRETGLLSKLLTMARGGASEKELLDEVAAVLGGIVVRAAGADRGLEWSGGSPGPSVEFLAQLSSLLEFSGLERAREASEHQLQLGQLIELISSGLAHPAAILPELEARGLAQNALRVSSWPAGSEGALSQRWGSALIGVTDRGVVLISGPEPEVSLRGPGLVCGYSAITDLNDLRRALSESWAALRLARNRGGVAGPEQLVSLDALLEQQSPDRLDPFIDQLIAPIRRADEEGRGDLMKTLKAFIEVDRQLQTTADLLYVHVNTVRHRLHRIHELTGRDPQTLNGIADLLVAVWAAERRETIGHRLIRPLQ